MTARSIARSLSTGAMDNMENSNPRANTVDAGLARIAIAKHSLLFRTKNNSSSADHKQQVLLSTMRDLENILSAGERNAETFRRGLAPKQPSLIEYGQYQFLITDSPTNETLHSYMATLRSFGVKHIVRLCEPLYEAEKLVDAGFKHHDWPFEDGGVPSSALIQKWLSLLDCIVDPMKIAKKENHKLKNVLLTNHPSKGTRNSDQNRVKSEASCCFSKTTIAVHCKTGLGRAPLLVAIALIELGEDALNAIGYIRARRRGAINTRQLLFLEQYKPRVPYNDLLRDDRSCHFM
eukprot:jgi/Galph1/5007/GphlegSOOS_G3647.1